MRQAFAILLSVASLGVAAATPPSARELIEASVRRHAWPAHVYEEQTFVLSDAQGRYSVRAVRHYARTDDQGTAHRLVIESPAESRGVSMQFAQSAEGAMRRGAAPATIVFGSGFTVADLAGEAIVANEYSYIGTQDVSRIPHHLVRARARAAGGASGERLLFLRKDNLFVTRIDHLDGAGKPVRRVSFRDGRPDGDGVWRADMILMEELATGRRSLVRVERRVHSPDYVPASLFAERP